MIFASKLAKLGKATHINCNQTSNEPLSFNVYVTNCNVSLKTLAIQNNTYTLSKPITTYGYAEMYGINSTYAVARIGLLKV